jgi:hypothetical protein
MQKTIKTNSIRLILSYVSSLGASPFVCLLLPRASILYGTLSSTILHMFMYFSTVWVRWFFFSNLVYACCLLRFFSFQSLTLELRGWHRFAFPSSCSLPLSAPCLAYCFIQTLLLSHSLPLVIEHNFTPTSA